MKLEDMTDEWILKEIEKIRYTYGLNRVIRYTLNRIEIYDSQSVAEHVYNMLILAHYFRDLEDPEHKLDMEKITKIILMHDMGEIETGDVIMAKKTQEHNDIESIAIETVASKSPDFIKNEIRDLYEEFENPQTPEGRFAKAIDKIEAPFWFTSKVDLSMIKDITSLEDRINNEAKRRRLYPILGYKIIERFATVLDNEASKLGLYE